MTNQDILDALAMLEEYFLYRSRDPKDLGPENADALHALHGLVNSALLRYHDITGLPVSGDVTGLQLLRASRAD